MMTMLEAAQYRIIDNMERELFREICEDKDVDIDERILDIMRVRAIFDGREDDFERWVASQKIAN